jgi:AcrR family transcriptional regulator
MTATAEGARERILKAANELFYSKGIRNVGIDEIIAQAGVAKASLYKHFESKDLLVLEWVRQRHEAWRQSLDSAAAKAGSGPRERLLAVFDELQVDCCRKSYRGCAFVNAMIELADPSHPAHVASLEHKKALREYMRNLAAEAGVKDPDGTAAHLAMLYEGAVVTSQAEGNMDAARRAREIAETIIQA